MSLHEQETIINFNKASNIASIFTYEHTWKRHLEERLGIKPIMVNGKGGREYEIDKRWLALPRRQRKSNMTPEQKEKVVVAMKHARGTQKRLQLEGNSEMK